MGSYTPNKNLYKADPETDGKDTFNITKLLNENWDKLDADTRELTFDELAVQYGVTESYPDADTGTITATIDDSAPVTAQRKTVVSKTSSGDLKFVETTTIDEVSTVVETTEGSTATTGDTAGQLNLDTIRWRLKRLRAGMGEIAESVDEIAAAERYATTTVTLTAAGWIGSAAPYTQTVAAADVSTTNGVLVSPRMENGSVEIVEVLGDCMVYATEQGEGSLTFTAYEDKPAIDLTFNVIVLI